MVRDEQNKLEYAICAIMLNNGVEGCTVGYLGREFHYFRRQYEHKLVEVVELLDDSKNIEHRRRSYVNKGIAVAFLIN